MLCQMHDVLRGQKDKDWEMYVESVTLINGSVGEVVGTMPHSDLFSRE